MGSRSSRRRQQRSTYEAQQKDSTSETGQAAQLPQKRLYRQRAHANPFSDHQLDYPISPEHMDWSVHFPAFIDPDPNKTNMVGARKLVKDVEVVDIGCGFGGLLVALGPLMPDTLMVGMEIRAQVLEYVKARVNALRAQKPIPHPPERPEIDSPDPISQPSTEQEQQRPSTLTSASSALQSAAPNLAMSDPYQNVSGIRANTMKFLPNFFTRHQLRSIFICFPDPHFKARKHKARIVSETLNAEYAFVLRPGGKVYTITDVEDLHYWIVGHFEGEGNDEHDEEAGGLPGTKELWERVSEEELASDPCVRVIMEETEEGKKVSRNKGRKFVAVWRRKPDPAWPSPISP